MTLLLLFAIGFVCGLRTMTPIAAISCAARLGWLNFGGTHLSWLGSTVAVTIFTLAALGEYVADQLPGTPARTVPVQFGARIVMGALCGAALAVAANQSLVLGVALGVIGAVAGTLLGYQARMGAVKTLHLPGLVAGAVEDLIAISAALLIASHL